MKFPTIALALAAASGALAMPPAMAQDSGLATPPWMRGDDGEAPAPPPPPASACKPMCANDFSPCDPIYFKLEDGRCDGLDTAR